ncbi:MAG: hypothetical protein JNM39_01325 [Bdellovibrionaceae bacterium]|nr:hypothetical protein [Pseudobdellovibrionaceae bacterium]
MSYLTNLKNEFSTAIRSRGQMYYHSDRVLVDSMAPGKEAELKVRGSQNYSVRLRFNGNNEHIWAAILEALLRLRQA